MKIIYLKKVNDEKVLELTVKECRFPNCNDEFQMIVQNNCVISYFKDFAFFHNINYAK